MTARRTLALALITSVALAGLSTVGATGASGAAPAAKVQPRTSVTNTSAFAIIKSTPIYYANGVAVNDADDTVYVTSSATMSSASAKLLAFNGRDWDDTNVPSTSGAWALAVDQSDDTVYVTHANGLCAFRGSDLTKNPSACTTGKGPMSAVAVDQGDDTVYGTVEAQDKIFTFKGSSDPGTYSPIVSFYDGDGGGAAVNSNDDTLYVPTANNLTLSRYSGPSTSVVNPSLAIAPVLLGVAVDQDDDTIYVNSKFGGPLYVVNGKTFTWDDTVGIANCNTTGSQGGVAVDQSDDTVYVACTNALRLYALDPANLDDTSVSIFTGGTDGVAVDNAGTNRGIVYATSQDDTFSDLWVIAPGVDPDVPPTTGPAGTAVTITLSIPNLASSFPLDSGTIAQVKFGSASGTSLQQIGGPTARTWSVAAPSGTAGTTVDVVVTFNGGQAALAGTFTYTGSPTPPTPTPVYPPGAPTDVKATAGSGEATVSWTPPTHVGSFPITDYQVTSSTGSHTCLSKTTSCTVTGLTGGTTYTFTVRALNGAGWGPYSSPSNAVTPPAKTILITGSRDGNDDRYVKVEGTTTDLAGKQVVPWVRFPGQTEYAAGTGVRTVSADGTFTWVRKTGKKTYVYFEHLAVRSNTVTIAAR